MPRITLPDGSVRAFDGPVTGREVAASIGPGLAKAAIGVTVDGELRDLSAPVTADASVAIVTPTRRDGSLDPDALFLLRHSTAHVMAEAITRLKPGVQLVYGPPVEDGFYYDMRFPEGVTLSSDEFEAIERVMAEIVKDDRPFTRYDLAVDEGLDKLRAEGSKYKLDNAERAIAAGADGLSFYASGTPGTDWEDLCRGPHVPSTGRIGAFKVTSLAASYWHGDASSDSLTRVYGTAFPDAKHLAAHLERIEEARARDHRALGRQLDLFSTTDAVGQGLVLWHPKGGMIRYLAERFSQQAHVINGYDWVYTPHIGKGTLWETSGHLDFYRDSMYRPIDVDGEDYYLKPMNCPFHCNIFKARPKSYRELPVRLAEYGTVYRYELSGVLHGLTRVRGFTQDDAHIFCTADQVHEEIERALRFSTYILRTFGLDTFKAYVSTRPKNKSIGAEADWARSTDALRHAVEHVGIETEDDEGGGAFYGPKIDLKVEDALGRQWQLSTIQFDFNLPSRFELEYTGSDGEKHRPMMVHRALFGSAERFFGLLIEHYRGAFPLWLAPVQVVLVPIADRHHPYARTVAATLAAAGMRVAVDDSGDRMNAKVRNAELDKVPFVLVMGDQEAEQQTVSVRARGEGNLGAKTVDEFLAMTHDDRHIGTAEVISG
ncbi:MAG: threonine--tRNA ligase [Phycisphaerales bacterium]|nr:threonine--tRNA ligase [Phycisphaerales bacterium]